MSNNKNNNNDVAILAAQAEIERLKAENEKLRQAGANKAVSGMKVTEKGAVSVYGLGRFPVTLYRGQWERLLSQAEAIQAFIKANEARLSVKPATVPEATAQK
jgi:hypothetical protein